MFKNLLYLCLAFSSSVFAFEQRIIVKYKPNFPMGMGAQAIQQEMARPFSATQIQDLSLHAKTSLKYSHAIGRSGAHVLSLPDGTNSAQRAAVVARLKSQADIAYVEEDVLMKPMLVPNDTSYASLWGMKPVSAGTSYGANFQTAWDTGNGSGVVVAVLDTGILPHTDIGSIALGSSAVSGNIISAGYDFISDCRVAATCPSTTSSLSATRTPVANAFDQGDWITGGESASGFFAGCTVRNSTWHGTHVAGTIAAKGNNSQDVIGGAYGAKILPVRVLGRCGGFVSDIANGILWAAGVHGTISNPNPAKVINMSLGGTSACGTTYQNAIDAATAAGVVVVVAAGNSNVNVSNSAPANCNNVIAVAATGQTGNRASYSNFGTGITLAAPGGDNAVDAMILSTLNSGTTTYNSSGFNLTAYQGTSMATPHVAAGVALMKAVNPAITTTQARTILQANVTAFPGGSTCNTSNCGAGILNAGSLAGGVNNLAPSSTLQDYGQVSVGNTSTANLSFTNNSGATATIGTVTLTNTVNYAITADSCSSQTIPNTNSCSVSVRFTAPASAQALGTLVVPATVSGTTINNGIALVGTSSRKLTASSSTLAMPTVIVNTSTSADLVLTNNSGSSVTVGSAAVNNSAFAIQSDTCSGQTLVNSQNCVLRIVSTPTSTGSYTGLLTINTTGGGDTASVVTLTGQANAAPATNSSSSSGGGGGGGGGAISWITLLGMLFFACVVRVIVRRHAV